MSAPDASAKFAARLCQERPAVDPAAARAFYEKARQTHADVQKPDAARFAHLVAQRLEAADADLAPLHAADLLLAAGALASDAAAVAAFRALLSRRVGEVLSTMRAPGTMRDEVEEKLLEKMLVAQPGKPARLSTFSGRGELSAWLGVSATRTAIELKRLKRYHVVDDVALDAGSGLRVAAADPELKLLQSSQSARFKKALHEAFESLTVEERNLLRLQLVDGLSATELGAIFQVNRATAARHVARARQVLVLRVREVMARRFRMTEESITSDLKRLGPHLELSLSRLLKAPAKE